MVILLLAVAGHGVEAKKPAREDSKVKNIIYMIGDGMGLCHVSMLQIEAGYAPTAFDRAKNTALIKTYSANNRVTDSAADIRPNTELAGSCPTALVSSLSWPRPRSRIMLRALW